MATDAQHISAALADAAFDRYEQSSAQAARYIAGQQLDWVTVSEDRAVRDFWRDTWLTCEREAVKHGG